MKCPYCYVPESKVTDSRASDNGRVSDGAESV